MKIFLDSADIHEIRFFADMGLVDGVTTNPSIIAASGRKIRDVIAEICGIISGPVSAEVTATDADMMVKEGLALAEIAKNVTVKVPLTWDGLKTCHILSKKNIMVNVTLCFSAAQAILAAKAGATFISPFVGRLDDIGQDGMQLIADIVNIYQQHPSIKTAVLSASIRHPIHAVTSAQMGADCMTIPPKVMRQMIQHPLTDKGIDIFLADWKKTNQHIL